MIQLGQIVLKGVISVHNDKIRSYGLKAVNGYTMINLGHMVLKGFNRVHNDKIGSHGLERSQLGT